MCTGLIGGGTVDAQNIPPPPPPPDYTSQQTALAMEDEAIKQKQLFAGLSQTIKTGPTGVSTPERTTRNLRG